VATDQKTSILNEAGTAAPAIENELPTYRAISALAIFSLVCGFGAVCSFAHPFFYLFAFLAIGLGIAAHRSIKHHPDMLTGTRLANAGIALGLIFGLVSATVSSVQYFVRSRAALKFAQEYAEIINRRSLPDMLWYNMGADSRKEKTPAEAFQEYETNRAKQAMLVDQKMGQMVKLNKRMATSTEQNAHFVRIEGIGEDESHGSLLVYALALYEVEGPSSKEFPEKQEYALAIFKGRSLGRHYDWWVEDIRYPYMPHSFVAGDKPVDDGHGHAH
jgi:Domain of unknown function (DUF4190)